jgi:hypothetical protein
MSEFSLITLSNYAMGRDSQAKFRLKCSPHHKPVTPIHPDR